MPKPSCCAWSGCRYRRCRQPRRPSMRPTATSCCGGTGQLITEIRARDLIEPAPLRVLGKNGQGQDVTLVDRVIESLPALHGGPACLFLETPTNPELQVHDFPRLMAALRAYQAETGHQI